MQIDDLVVELGCVHAIPLIDVIFLDFERLDVVDMPLNLVLQVADIRGHLIMHVLLVIFEAGIVLIRLVELVALVLKDTSRVLQLIVKPVAHVFHLIDRLTAFLLVEIELITMGDFKAVHALGLAITSLLLEQRFTILMLRHQPLNLTLQLADLRNELLLAALVAAELRGKACSEIVALDLDASELVRDFIVALPRNSLLICDLHSKLLDSLLLPSNHDLLLLQLHLKKSLYVLIRAASLLFELPSAAAALAHDVWLGGDAARGLLSQGRLDINRRA